MKASPILKWAGGKGGLLAQYDPYFPMVGSYRSYLEPFVGSAAVFFHLQPQHAILMDRNPELIEVYQMIRDQLEALITALKAHRNERDYFYAVRAQKIADLSPVERAARFIFLNKTCYNGLYRVNRSGQFNVPFGRYTNPAICDESKLNAAHNALQSVELGVANFDRVLAFAQPGDFVYFDPPYEPLSSTSNFTSYTRDGFSADDQRQLADVFRQLDTRGCRLMLSNSSALLIYDLYQGYAIHEISARRAINRNANGRGVVTELLITNFNNESLESS